MSSLTLGQNHPIRLWNTAAPLAKGEGPGDIPTITPYIADAAGPASAVVVLPGGGYQGLANHEGHDVALWLNGLGIHAFVLRYRLGPTYQHPTMLTDASRALRTVRSHASAWNIKPDHIGIMGSSAGGHLASTLSNHFSAGDDSSADAVARVSDRPDLAILLYPVINLDDDTIAHAGSRRHLLGTSPDPALVRLLSNEQQVTARTPPTFVFTTADDASVSVENSLRYVTALRRAGVPFELHAFETGRHGIGLAPEHPTARAWPGLCAAWLGARGWTATPADRGGR